MSGDRGPSIVLAELWERQSKHGNQYFAGFLGGLSVALLRDGERPHPTRPDETVTVWKLLLQERDRPAKAPARPVERDQASAAPATRPEPAARPEPRERRRRPFAKESERARVERVAREIGGDGPDFDDPIPFG